jgi:hypothetical protein
MYKHAQYLESYRLNLLFDQLWGCRLRHHYVAVRSPPLLGLAPDTMTFPLDVFRLAQYFVNNLFLLITIIRIVILSAHILSGGFIIASPIDLLRGRFRGSKIVLQVVPACKDGLLCRAACCRRGRHFTIHGAFGQPRGAVFCQMADTVTVLARAPLCEKQRKC